MVIFKQIRYKNFLATGNSFTIINLNKFKNTLIVGSNGAGKSTLTDAICFALFGKPYRNINKPSIINSINNKDCLVELDFSIGNKNYMVRRGIKPNIFEISQDGSILNQDARVNDYQEMFEKFILRMNFKSFTQIVILGSSSFIPFMSLSANERRCVIEDLLDIQIFSKMNQIVKDNINNTKNLLNEYKIRVETIKEKIELHKRHINEKKKNNAEMISAKRDEIANSTNLIIKLESDGLDIQKKIDKLLSDISDYNSTKEKFNKLFSLETKIGTNLNNTRKEVTFFDENDSCPTCQQEITSEFKTQRIHKCSDKVNELNASLEKLLIEKESINKRLGEIIQINTTIQELGKELANTNSNITHTNKYINILECEVASLIEQMKNNTELKDQSEELVSELSSVIDKRKVETENKNYLDIATTLLKDGGIKTKIIKQYLPIINKTVNKYLSSMDFFINFTIDEEFKETIKSRHRDDFSYENFSEGEKQKIDLALLLTWRVVAKLKNSVHTNILILDETFDSSLDSKGTDSLLEILHGMPDSTNIFVISHKDQLHDKFEYSIRFEKKNNFSVMV